jgi:serine phosphatase RsbU (regulator of sigma subunit)
VLAAEVARVAEDNARLYSEQRSVAQTLQQSLLLEVLPEVPGLELAARYEAGAEGVDIGGDWYDVIPRGEDCVLLVVGDVSGRGVRAATVMAALRHSVRALAMQGDAAAVILTKLSRLVSLEHDGHFATVLIVEVDPRRGTLAVASAGHARPLVLTDGGADFIEVEVGVPVGVAREPSYLTAAGQLQPGSTLLGFTDGLFERRGETVDSGLERLRATAEASRGAPLEDLLDVLVVRLAGTPQDDAAILGVRWPTSTTPRS